MESKSSTHGLRYTIATYLFQILLGLTFFFAFASLLPQMHTLIGKNGIIPITDFVVAAHGSMDLHNFPTLLQFFNSDFTIFAVVAFGAIFSLLLIFGILPRLSLICCFVLYLSIVVAGRDFFYFQWDNLLLEASFIAFFMPLRSWKRPVSEPNGLLVFLFRWLLFRLYFESGIAKLLYGQGTWLNLSAMKYYYETAPLPSFGGWLAQQLLPGFIHELTAILVFAAELIVPFAFFLPQKFRRMRIAAFYITAGFNAILAFTSNYGFFNFLSSALGIFLLDDQHIRFLAGKIGRLLRVKQLSSSLDQIKISSSGSRIGFYFLVAFAIVSVPFSVAEFTGFAKSGIKYSAVVGKVVDAYTPYRIINIYHLFPGIVRERIVPEISGSADGVNWKPFLFKYTPNDPKSMPPWLPMYQARFAFQYSFLTLGQVNSQYFSNLVAKLCNSPQQLNSILAENPFNKENPQQLKLDFYRYKFSKPADLIKNKVWWTKEYAGSMQGTIKCNSSQ